MMKNNLLEHLRELNEQELYEELYIDPITGVLNRRAFEYSEFVGCMSIVIIDLDSLKYVNDELGHRAGDQKLKDLCNGILSRAIFNIDNFYRLSGDEFVGVSFDKNKDKITKELNNLRELPWHNCFSFGLDHTLEKADIDLRYDKKRRELSGERAKRGECPPWIFS